MKRQIWVLIHRYAGLTIAGFLILIGLTGSLLSFLDEINHYLSPHLFPDTHAEYKMGPGELAEKAQALLPHAEVTNVFLNASGSAMVTVAPAIDPSTGKAYELGFNQLFLDAGSGEELGRRRVGGLPTELDAIMPFLYRLHFALSLGETGGYILGVVALIWTIDCFVAFYLTLPSHRKKAPSEKTTTSKGFWLRWKPAWLVKWSAGATRINFDLHRAGGLWLWGLLLVFAWSSVGFNLNEVYRPVMGLFFDMPANPESVPAKPAADAKPLPWRDAQQIAERLMQEQAARYGFSVIEPVALYRLADKGLYHYRVRSSRDVKSKNGATKIHFDLYTGALRDVSIPTGQYNGITVTQWLFALHEANVFGLPYRILVCITGLVIVMLSVTGVIIWLRKRRSAKPHRIG